MRINLLEFSAWIYLMLLEHSWEAHTHTRMILKYPFLPPIGLAWLILAHLRVLCIQKIVLIFSATVSRKLLELY
jgi:hypothetical protein